MTRKDYETLARAIAGQLAPQECIALPERERAAIYFTARAIADALYDDNARFDRVRFMKACGFNT